MLTQIGQTTPCELKPQQEHYIASNCVIMAQTKVRPTRFNTPLETIIQQGNDSSLGGEIARIPSLGDGLARQNAAISDFPWMAALVSADEPNGFFALLGGGTLIHPEWILTAAHSVTDDDGNAVDTNTLDVLMRTDILNKGGIRYDIASILVHPNFQPTTFDSDLALLRLEKPIADVEPLPLIVPTEEGADPVTPGTTATVLGWGELSPTSPPSNVLQQTDLTILSNEEAISIWGGVISDNMLAAGVNVNDSITGIPGIAPGDSGGPLFVPDAEGFAHAGIASFVEENFQAPPVFTRTSQFSSWIDGNTEDLDPGVYVGDATVTEGDANFNFITFTIRVVGVREGTVRLNYQTADGTAIAGQDYTPANGVLEFDIIPEEEPETDPEEPDPPPPPIPDVTRTIQIGVLGDTIFESDKTFSLQLSNATVDGTALDIQQETSTGVIVDNDPIPEAIREFRQQDNSKNPLFRQTAGAFSTPTFSDIDGDGDFDAFVGTELGNLFFFRNVGTAEQPNFAFAEVNPFGLSGLGRRVNPTLGDLDGDGDQDLIVGASDGSLWFIPNTGTSNNPQFGTPQQNPFGLAAVSDGGHATPVLVDMDRDGDLDILSGNAEGDSIYFENTGSASNPQFGTPVTNPFGLVNAGAFSRPTVGDLTGDGDLEIMMGNRNGTNLLFFNAGTRSQPVYVPIYTQENPLFGRQAGRHSAPSFVDINGDGDLDLFAGNESGQLLFFENVGFDSDNDTIPDDIENTVGDRNKDGIADSQQGYVASLAPFNGDDRNANDFITFTAPSDTQFTRFDISNEPLFNSPSLPDVEGLTFPLDYFDFTLNLSNASSSSVVLDVLLPNSPANQNYNSFWTLSPVGNTNRYNWTQFGYDGRTGAQFFDINLDGFADKMLLHLQDGERGDEVAEPDDNILLFGAPAANNEQLSLTADESQIFTVNGESGTGILSITLQGSDNHRINEIGVLRVDANNRINGLYGPGDQFFSYYTLLEGETLFNVLTNKSDQATSTVPITQTLQVSAGERLMFYMIENQTRDTLLNLIEREVDVDLSNIYYAFADANSDGFDHLNLSQPSLGNFNLAWEDSRGGGDLDFNDAIFDLSLENRLPALPQLASNTQTEYQGELLDLQFLAGEQIQVSFPVITSEADYTNTVGLYRVENEAGTVLDPLSGGLVSPGNSGYTQAAVRRAQADGMVFGEFDSGVTKTLSGGTIWAPFLISNGTVQDALEGNSETPVYVAYISANIDQSDHVLLIGENTWSFEDQNLLAGGDGDFNDIIMQADVSLV